MGCPDDDRLAAMLQGYLDDAQVRALEAHLDGCPACMQLVVGLVADDSSGDRTDALPQVGRFDVLERVGAGAQGLVVAAWDPQLQRRVALKLLRPDRDPDPTRLQREARLLASLSHPNVMPVFEVGTWGDGLYLATELGRGSLRDWVADVRPWRDVVRTWVGVGAGLAAAHAAGLVHRDVKPDNVVLHPDSRPLLTDFGLASASPDQERAAGTPRYLAPELADGAAADARSDQFALCVSLYECLAGAPPTRKGPPARPAGVPAAVHAVVCRGLRADPADRFADVDALCTALKQASVARRRWPVAVAALAVAALAVTGVVAGPWGVQTEPVSQVASPPTPVPAPLHLNVAACDAAAADVELERCADPVCARRQWGQATAMAHCYANAGDCDEAHRWLDALAAVGSEAPVENIRGALTACVPRPGDRRAQLRRLMWAGRVDCTEDGAACLDVGTEARRWAADPIATEDDLEGLWWLQLAMVQTLHAWHGDPQLAKAEAGRAEAAFGRAPPEGLLP